MGSMDDDDGSVECPECAEGSVSRDSNGVIACDHCKETFADFCMECGAPFSGTGMVICQDCFDYKVNADNT
jgi:primosomal protein N'